MSEEQTVVKQQRKPRIHWSDEEKSLIAELIAKELRHTPAKNASGRVMLKALRKAAKVVIPAERMREIGTMAAYPWVVGAVAEAQTALQAERESQPKPAVAVESNGQEPEPLELYMGDEGESADSSAAAPQVTYEPELTENLVAELAVRAVRYVTQFSPKLFEDLTTAVLLLGESFARGRLPQLAPTQPVQQAVPIPPTPPQPKSQKPRFLIYGLLPHQERVIIERFNDAGRFWFKKNNLTGDLPDVDACFLSKFGSHSDQERLRQRYGREMVEFVPGGLGRIMDKIAAVCRK